MVIQVGGTWSNIRLEI